MRLLPCELMLVGTGSPSRPSRVAAAIDVWAEPVEAEGLNSRIVQAALRLSEYLGAGLDVVSVVPFVPALNRAWPSSKAVYAEADADHRQSFARFLAAHGIPEDRSHRLAGVPADELVRFAADNQIEVLVLGSIHHGGWDRFLLGSTAEAVAQQIACDLLVVKPADYAEVLSDQRGARPGSP
jgi:universal stress protein E